MGAIYLREVVRYRGVLVVRDGVPVSRHSIAQGASGLANVHGRAGSACDRVNDISGRTGVVPWWARQKDAVSSLDEWTRLAPRGLVGMCSGLVGRAKVSRGGSHKKMKNKPAFTVINRDDGVDILTLRDLYFLLILLLIDTSFSHTHASHSFNPRV